jgi:hypothetical protein
MGMGKLRRGEAYQKEHCPFPPSWAPAFYHGKPLQQVIIGDERTCERLEKLWDKVSFIIKGIASLRRSSFCARKYEPNAQVFFKLSTNDATLTHLNESNKSLKLSRVGQCRP